MKLKKFSHLLLFFWLPALVWAGIIFYLSHQPGLKAGFSTPNEILFRKFAHLIEFGVLGWLFWRIFHYVFEWKLKISFPAAFFCASLYALSDEIHQIFIYDRKGKFQDVLLDCLGVLSFLLITTQIYLRKIFKKFIIAFFIVLFTIYLLVVSMIREGENAAAEKEDGSEQISSVSEEKKSEGALAEEAQEQVTIKNGSEGGDLVGEDYGSGSEDELEIAEKILIDVPFSSQAPFAVWDDVHEEACEETSLIMVKYYLEGKKLTPQMAESEIQGLKEYQLNKTGDYHDSNMEQLVEIAEDHYGIKNLEVVYDFSKQDLKKELAKGNPVIVPTAGRELGNPNFTQPGPLYHNLVIRGYDGNTIITNDPGTRKGEGFEYGIDVIYAAIHDFPGKKEDILDGRKAMIVIR